MRRKLTLSIEADLIDQMKIRCILEKRELSTITEELYREHLKGSEKLEANSRDNPQDVPGRRGNRG